MNYPGYTQPKTLDPNIHSLQRALEIEQLTKNKACLEGLIRLTFQQKRRFNAEKVDVRRPTAELRQIKRRLRELTR